MKRSLSGVVICLLVGLLCTIIKQGITIAQSNTISLSTPYYGNETITAYFDHKYPTYGNPPNDTYTRTVRFDGVDSPSCEPVCYDGHDGTDFGMSYG